MLCIVYHQHTVLHIIKPQVNTRWCVMRYSPRGADDIHDCVVMICQACGLDKEKRHPLTECRFSLARVDKKDAAVNIFLSMLLI